MGASSVRYCIIVNGQGEVNIGIFVWIWMPKSEFYVKVTEVDPMVHNPVQIKPYATEST